MYMQNTIYFHDSLLLQIDCIDTNMYLCYAIHIEFDYKDIISTFGSSEPKLYSIKFSN